MKNYRFDLIHTSHSGFREKDHIIPASSLTDAIQKFARKHELEAPFYWDEPSFDKYLDIIFRNDFGELKYQISWK